MWVVSLDVEVYEMRRGDAVVIMVVWFLLSATVAFAAFRHQDLLGDDWEIGDPARWQQTPDLRYDWNSEKIKTPGIIMADVGDPPDSAFRRSGPDGGNRYMKGTPTEVDRPLGLFYWQAYDGNDWEWNGTVGRSAQFYARLRQDPRDGRAGSLHFGTTRPGEGEPSDALVIDQYGVVHILGNLVVHGSILSGNQRSVSIRRYDRETRHDDRIMRLEIARHLQKQH